MLKKTAGVCFSPAVFLLFRKIACWRHLYLIFSLLFNIFAKCFANEVFELI